MVLPLKRWKSRSSPGFAAGVASARVERTHSLCHSSFVRVEHDALRIIRWLGAGWSSPVARQAHNLKVAGSNPAPATTEPFPEQPAPPVGPSPGRPFVAAPRQAHNLKVAGSNPAPQPASKAPPARGFSRFGSGVAGLIDRFQRAIRRRPAMVRIGQISRLHSPIACVTISFRSRLIRWVSPVRLSNALI